MNLNTMMADCTISVTESSIEGYIDIKISRRIQDGHAHVTDHYESYRLTKYGTQSLINNLMLLVGALTSPQPFTENKSC